jgi:hypothetical protein
MPSLGVLVLSGPSGFQQACMTANALVEENETYFQDLVQRRGSRVNFVLLDATLNTTEKTDPLTPPSFSLFSNATCRFVMHGKVWREWR